MVIIDDDVDEDDNYDDDDVDENDARCIWWFRFSFIELVARRLKIKKLNVSVNSRLV